MAYNYLFGGFKKQDIIDLKLTPYETEFLRFLDFKENALNHDDDPVTHNNKIYYKYNLNQLNRDLCFFKSTQFITYLIKQLNNKGLIERIDRNIWRTQLYLRLTDKYFEIKPKTKRTSI